MIRIPFCTMYRVGYRGQQIEIAMPTMVELRRHQTLQQAFRGQVPVAASIPSVAREWVLLRPGVLELLFQGLALPDDAFVSLPLPTMPRLDGDDDD